MEKSIFENDNSFFKSNKLDEGGNLNLIKTKYYRREGSPGKYKYYYTEEQYRKEKGMKKEKAGNELRDPIVAFEYAKAQRKELDKIAMKNTEKKKPEDKSSNKNTLKIGDKTFKLNTTTKENKTVSTISDGKGTVYNSKPGEDVNDFVKRAHKQIKEDFGKKEKKDTEKKKPKLNYQAERLLDLAQTSKADIKFEDLTVDSTPQGNWLIYHKGKPLSTIRGNLLSDTTIMKYNLEHYGIDDQEKSSNKNTLKIGDKTLIITQHSSPASIKGISEKVNSMSLSQLKETSKQIIQAEDKIEKEGGKVLINDPMNILRKKIIEMIKIRKQ